MGLERDPQGRGSFVKKDAPDPAMRVALETRQRMLRSHMVPVSADDLDVMLASFFMGYSSMRNRTPDEFDKALDEYCKVLAGLPAWALDDALTNAASGGTDPRYVPNAAELRWKAQAAMRPFEKELHDIGTILDAKIVDDPKQTLEERIETADRYWTNGARLTVSTGGGLVTEEEQRTKEELRAENVMISQAFVQAWNKRQGHNPHSPHSPALRAKFAEIAADLRKGNAQEEVRGQQPQDRSRSA